MDETSGKIFLVPTPIGNMDDITKRAVDTLESVDIIACEDTRHSGNFLKKLGIKKKLVSYHDFNESARAKELIDEVAEGKNIAVITDGGSPGISDPAYRIVKLATDHKLAVVPLPGPTALIPALTASGLPTDRFFFEGFLSNKSSARRKRLQQLVDFPHTLIFYESPHRIEKMITDAHEIFGARQACLAREITKKFEQFIYGSLAELKEVVHKKKLKGEMVIIVEGNRSKK